MCVKGSKDTFISQLCACRKCVIPFYGRQILRERVTGGRARVTVILIGISSNKKLPNGSHCQVYAEKCTILIHEMLSERFEHDCVICTSDVR